MERLGFVGLGVMGAPMASHLIASGAPVAVFNRTRGKAERLSPPPVYVAESLAELGHRCDTVFLCVSRSEDVEECLEGLIPGLAPGKLVVDHSTIAPVDAERFHNRLANLGIAFVDAPITGGSMGAQAGTLTIFCGGAEEDCSRAVGLVRPYAKRAERVGAPGSGQRMKLANQIAVGGALLGLCESLAFAKKAGLDLKQALELIGSGAGGSWAFDFYGPKILNRDWTPGFSVANQRKDFAYAKEAAASLGARIPATDLADELLAILEELGRSNDTTAALYEVYEQ